MLEHGARVVAWRVRTRHLIHEAVVGLARHADESERLARAADPEREYVDVILPAKLQGAAAYAERATLWTDIGVLVRSLRVLLAP